MKPVSISLFPSASASSLPLVLLLTIAAQAYSEPIDQTELATILARARQTEEIVFKHSVCKLHVSDILPPDRLTPDILHRNPARRPDGRISSTVIWARDGDKWRCDAHFDLDKRLQSTGTFFDHTCGFDGTRLFRLTRGHSVNINPPSPRAAISGGVISMDQWFFQPFPQHWLAECIRDRLIESAHHADNGDVILRIRKTDWTTIRTVTLDSHLDYVVISWRSVDENYPQRGCVIEYERVAPTRCLCAA